MQDETRDERPGSTSDEPGPPVVPPDGAVDEAVRPSRRAAWLAMGAVMLALGLIWLAPGIGDQRRITDWAGYENPGDPDDADATGRRAPLQFTVQDMHGDDVRLAAFRGRVILLNFWATWCPPCRVEIPDLVALQEAYGDDLVVLGLSIDDTVDKLVPFAEEFRMNYPVLVGRGREEIQDAYGVWGLPVSVIIDREGRIVRKHSGLASRDQLERWIEPLLGAPAS
jgi:thiol-disulfide isomerase/thioredoxin